MSTRTRFRRRAHGGVRAVPAAPAIVGVMSYAFEAEGLVKRFGTTTALAAG
ncbi:hypothetical protein ACIODS_23560 [Micromonospora chalcea]|uniref:hypothetical protein n=1 Tax=Micromonospora chalcea TaxID=1874 RepID=UPI003826AD13